MAVFLNDKGEPIGPPLNTHLSVAFSFVSPTEWSTAEERAAAFAEIGNVAATSWTECMDGLNRIVRRNSPFSLMSHFAYYDLLLHDLYTDKSKYQPLKQYSVELLQALFLTVPVSEIVSAMPDPEDKLEANKLLGKVGLAFMQKRMGRRPGDEMTPVREAARMNTQTNQYTGGIIEVSERLKELISPLDELFLAKRGLLLTDLISISVTQALQVEKRMNHLREGLVLMTHGGDAGEIVKTFAEFFNLPEGSEQFFLELVERDHLTKDQVEALLYQYSETFHPDIFVLDVEILLATMSDAPTKECVCEALDRWALPLGQLAGRNVERFFLDNPVWKQPLIPVGSGRYFWPVILGFASFAFDLVEKQLEGDDELKRKYHDCRAAFLEKKVAKLIETIAPGTTTIYRNLKWRLPAQPETEYETDVLALIDRHVLIVECKSGKIDASARRGGDRIYEVIRELIQEPTEQSYRLQRLLESPEGPITFSDAGGAAHTIDRGRILRITRLNVTLESIGPLSSNHKTLKQAGVISTNTPPAPTLSLADLENVLYLVESPLQRLHYLHRRAQVQGNYSLVGDEMDLLAYYFSTGFSLWPEDRTTLIVLMGHSDQLDPYLQRRALGIAGQLPRLRLNRWWSDILERLDQGRFDGWTELGFVLLCFPFKQQEEYEMRVEQVRKNIRRDPKAAKGEDVVVASYPSSDETVAIGTFIAGDISLNILNSKARYAAQNLYDLTKANRCAFLVLPAHANTHMYPYFRLGLVLPPK